MLTYIQNAFASTLRKKSIPSLDGIRAVSILLVLLGHGAFLYKSELPRFANYLSTLQGIGVSIFFVISGFLINSLLINEKNKHEKINFKIFYLKRLLRIFPPYYFYIICILLYSYFYYVMPTKIEIASALTYTWNYVYSTSYWLLGHSWSLSVEEQFYLTWPFLLAFLSFKSSKKIALVIIFLSPAIRLLTYFLFPLWQGRISIMLHTRMDALMFGCFLAYIYDKDKLLELFSFISKMKIHYLSFLFLFIISPMLRINFAGKYALPFGYTLEALSISVLLIYFINVKEEKVSFKILNNIVFRHLGVLSYGLYLWQQFFLFHELHFMGAISRIILLYLTVVFIYVFLEYPISKLSKLLQRRL